MGRIPLLEGARCDTGRHGVNLCKVDLLNMCLVSRRRFLNRLLGLPVARQNLLFAYFTATLGAEIRAAKAEGRYFEGVSDLGGSHVSKVEPKVRAPLLVPPAQRARCLGSVQTWDFCITHGSSDVSPQSCRASCGAAAVGFPCPGV